VSFGLTCVQISRMKQETLFPAGLEVSDGQMGLAEVIGQIEATILIGLSTAGVAFSEPIVREKARKVDRPIREGEHPELRPSIFCSPGSPNKRRECTGKSRQFNGFGLVQAGSGPGGRWFKPIRPDHFSLNQQFTGTQSSWSAWSQARRSKVQINFGPTTPNECLALVYGAFAISKAKTFCVSVYTKPKHDRMRRTHFWVVTVA